MDDKLFELIEKMYSEMQNGFTEVRGEIKNLNHSVIKLENKVDNNLKALYDGYNQNTEKLCMLEYKINDLSNKVERQELEIRVINGGKGILKTKE